MNSNDFNKLMGLLSKLNAATNRATEIDGSFRKYHTQSIDAMKDWPTHLKRLEQGLKTAKILQ
jgi:hypothetical protein